ncbi:hypothetical protein P9112_010732 [Eukaryota sp. TZLM1-RC]
MHCDFETLQVDGMELSFVNHPCIDSPSFPPSFINTTYVSDSDENLTFSSESLNSESDVEDSPPMFLPRKRTSSFAFDTPQFWMSLFGTHIVRSPCQE